MVTLNKRIVIAGCRDYFDYSQAIEYIDMCLRNIRNQFTIIIVSGGCRGADMLGLRYAAENKMDFEIYKADWTHFGRAAGPLETVVWRRYVIMLFASGTGKAKVHFQ